MYMYLYLFGIFGVALGDHFLRGSGLVAVGLSICICFYICFNSYICICIYFIFVFIWYFLARHWETICHRVVA